MATQASLRLSKPVSRLPKPGALVKTRRVWCGGVHRDEVKAVFHKDGEPWLEGSTWSFPLSEMEVIRDAVGDR